MNAARTGADTTEKLLTPRNVNAREFGHRFRIPADGDVYAQPLVLPQVRLADGRIRDLVFVATEHNSVDAWDASMASARPVWHTSFNGPGAGVTPIPSRELHCPFIKPEVGITCTPVIDPRAGTIYVLARTREEGAGVAVRYVQRLHALDVRTGAERAGSPVEIHAIVRGEGRRRGRRHSGIRPAAREPPCLAAPDRGPGRDLLGVLVRRGPLSWVGHGLRRAHPRASRSCGHLA